MNPCPKPSGEGGEGLQLRPHTRERTKLQTLPTLRDTLLPRLISDQLRLPEALAEMEEAA